MSTFVVAACQYLSSMYTHRSPNNLKRLCHIAVDAGKAEQRPFEVRRIFMSEYIRVRALGRNRYIGYFSAQI